MKKVQKTIDKLRKNIPKEYNQAEMLSELTNPEISYYINISNRGDGKTFTYMTLLVKLAVECDMTILLLGRTWSDRQPIFDDCMETMHEIEASAKQNYGFTTTNNYISINVDGERRIVISDLATAGRLKKNSKLLKKCSVIWYDEFIALDYEYMPDEFRQLKIIYNTVDREDDYRRFEHPKVLLTGNPENFNSPIIAGIKIFDELELMNINEPKVINALKTKAYVLLGRNEKANEKKNVDIFDDGSEDIALTGEFRKNDYLIAKKKTDFMKRCVVKFEEQYMVIYYNQKMEYVVEFANYIDDYKYCDRLINLKDGVKYLDDKYFDHNHSKKYERGEIKFKNNYSINYIDQNDYLKTLKIRKLLSYDHIHSNRQVEEVDEEIKRKKERENYMVRTKKLLSRVYND